MCFLPSGPEDAESTPHGSAAISPCLSRYSCCLAQLTFAEQERPKSRD
ncbi:hypothetical protein LEMLEM_LOCUS1381 [Lemmus lemmus]